MNQCVTTRHFRIKYRLRLILTLLSAFLWSRLGAPLIGPDGKRYASGTEYEVASARDSWKAAGSPETMIYLHDAPAQIRQFPDSEFQKMIDQLKALKRFVAEYCQEQKNFLSAVDKTTLTDIQNALNRNKGQGAQN
jgi:hypothetical protein